MIRISFPISSKCSCCTYLDVDEKNNWCGDDELELIIKCVNPDKCPINMERNLASVFGIEMDKNNSSPFIKKL